MDFQSNFTREQRHAMFIFWTRVQQYFGVLVLAFGLSPRESNASMITFSGDQCSWFYQTIPIDTNTRLLSDLLRDIKNPPAAITILDRDLLGPLIEVYDLVKDPTDNKIKPLVNEVRRSELKRKTNDAIQLSLNSPVTQQTVSELLNKILNLETLDNHSVIIRFKNWHLGDFSETKLERAIRFRMISLYMEMANWTYRLSGLEKNETAISMTMLDEMGMYLQATKGFTFHLGFDKAVWEKVITTLRYPIEQFINAKTEATKDLVLGYISKPDMPFLPFAGAAVASNMFSLKAPSELKRYFSNALEDPLNLTSPSSKNEFTLRHRILYQMVEQLPEGSPVEIHAHTVVHARAYTKLGFKNTKVIKNEKYPDVTIYLLEAKREDILHKISTILTSK